MAVRVCVMCDARSCLEPHCNVSTCTTITLLLMTDRWLTNADMHHHGTTLERRTDAHFNAAGQMTYADDLVTHDASSAVYDKCPATRP
eukprot:m.188158 g.188158  ORF g.188158 m.188158 type:complete len:88 (-) comp17308_c0_seq1:80-343(-)